MNTIDRSETIGLALGGGAVLGAAHIGVLQALEEFDVPIAAIAGTSIGAFIAALYAFGKNGREIEQITSELDWLDITAATLSQYGLLTNKKLGETLHDVLGDVAFDDAQIPLAMVAADISRGEKVVLEQGDVATAVMASTCIPGVFIPIEIGDRMLVDGGILENVPVFSLENMGVERVIAVDLNAKHAFKPPKNLLEVLLNTFDMTMINATKLQTKDADILIGPDLASFNLIDTEQFADLVAQGYTDAKKILQNHLST
jgi:NTE family protein